MPSPLLVLGPAHAVARRHSNMARDLLEQNRTRPNSREVVRGQRDELRRTPDRACAWNPDPASQHPSISISGRQNHGKIEQFCPPPTRDRLQYTGDHDARRCERKNLSERPLPPLGGTVPTPSEPRETPPQADETGTELTKTVHPQATIACKTLEIAPPQQDRERSVGASGSEAALVADLRRMVAGWSWTTRNKPEQTRTPGRVGGCLATLS